MNRPDQENLDTLLAHIKQIGYGETVVEIGVTRGLISYWKEKETKRGNKAPFRKIEREED